MSTSEKYPCKGRRQKIPNRQAPPISPETSSDPSSKPHAASSAAPEKKTRGTAGRADAQHPHTKSKAVSPLSPVSPVSHTHTPARNGHLTQNTSGCSLKTPQRGRKKKCEKKERSDFSPDERSGPGADPGTTRTEQQKARISPPEPAPPRTLRPRAAKETSTHATLSCTGSPQDTHVSSPKPDSAARTPTTRRGRRPKPRLSSTPQRSRTPQSRLQISPITKTLPKRVPPQNPEAQQRKRPRKKVEQEVCEKPPVKRQRKKRSAKAARPPSQRIRTRFVLEDSEHLEPATLSSSTSEWS
ncbi:hypothetical protein QTP70_033425 [Hemibagrus guttatus]|uniref:Uncharacterized protein n=1 Tax=Hemibagrus guttatus TaxID=175788 RepID=A0AAE0R9M3_9TELE|nr:hypothetical protein QTP70_033425 [Hemibagrus guttatus]KAK3568145.1 hypothetical protein QTP86_031997 [Hemibagrus guttatus]